LVASLEDAVNVGAKQNAPKCTYRALRYVCQKQKGSWTQDNGV